MTVFGLDLLGLGSVHWPINPTLNHFPRGWALGVFDGAWPNAFGDPRRNMRLLLQTGKVSAVRVHIWWGGKNHTIVPLDLLSKRVPLYEAMAKQWPAVKWYISPSCEYREHSVVEIQKRLEMVRHLAPSCTPILSPEGGSPSLASAMSEEHGKNASAGLGQIASWDGNACYDYDVDSWKKRNSAAAIQFLWGLRFNGYEVPPKDHESPPPNQRKAFPDGKYLRSVTRQADPLGTAPMKTFPGTVIPFNDHFCLKSHGEDMWQEQPRDNKPLIIVGNKAPHAELLTFDGQTVGNFPMGKPPTDTFPGGRFRYYSGFGDLGYGWEISDKAIHMSGSPYVWFKCGNHIYGPGRADFRCGFYGS